MQLNKFSDYALRVLMYVSRSRDVPYTIAEIAENLVVSENHLIKVVHFMAKQQWIITTRGKGGGIRLQPETLSLKLGNILTTLEGDTQIVNCATPPCIMRSHCGLKPILDQAMDQFYHSLNQYTLGDVIQKSAPKSFQNDASISLMNL